MARDDFPKSVREKIAARVGLRRSKPGCQKLTSGPAVDPVRAINIGERKRFCVLLCGCLLTLSCAGYRGGWKSVAYLGESHPGALITSTSLAQGHDLPELNVPGLNLRVTIDNQLRTYDTQVYFFALPLSVDPRHVYPKNHVPGKTRVFITVTPQASGFIFRPATATLQVKDKHFTGAAGFEFAMWDEQWNRVLQGGKWEHRPINADLALVEVGRQYFLSIDFETPVPSPESHDITLDLSQALTSASEAPLPLIRFAPVRWKEGYT